MEHEPQRMIHEPSSSTSAYCSILEELDGSSSSVCTSVVEESTYWTSIESASDTDDEGYVRTVLGEDVQKYNRGQIELLEKIGEGGQGTVYIAELCAYKMLGINSGLPGKVAVAKVYKQKSGQWPEDVFRLHLFHRHICQFNGYCLDGESFYLLMPRYDGSLRDLLDSLMKNKCKWRPISHVDFIIESQCKRRPFADLMTLAVIIQIALGMCTLHENNIIHRDLKADNVFVNVTGFSNGVYPTVFIGDFDVASRVVGTLFWRAPEILHALKEGKRPVFTPRADVYSYAMTCYEILTGGVPLEGIRASDYDSVLQRGVRPELPSNLNPKFKDLMTRCWHQDPESRPTFKEIVVELRELHRELFIGSEIVSRSLDRFFIEASSFVDNEASPEACLLELKTLLQALLAKYGQEEFLLLGVEIVAHLEQYQLEFGLRSYKEHPVLPYPEYMKRHMLHDRYLWRLEVFRRINPFVGESIKINLLLIIITTAVSDNYTFDHTFKPSKDYTASQYESEIEKLRHFGIYFGLYVDLKAWKEECAARVLPEIRHVVCSESPQHTCDLCKSICNEAIKDLDQKEDFLELKSHLYVEKD